MPFSIPHPERIIILRVSAIGRGTADIIRVTLTRGECFCAFSASQYLGLWKPDLEYLRFIKGDILDTLEENGLMNEQRDIYAAGPPAMLRALARALDERSVSKDRGLMDSFGV